MKKILTICLLLFGSLLYSQITVIPDSEFEEYLVLSGIDTDGIINGQILTSDIDQRTTLILPGNPSITDLTGIEGFTSLEVLSINSVNITELNLSENLNLKNLDIADVSLINLDLSNNLMLKFFATSLNFSGAFFTSPITNIDFSSNNLLSSVFITETLITDLDFSNNTNINGLELLHMPELTQVNISNNNNQNLLWLQLLDNPNLSCLQVDDPQAVIDALIPPYDNWDIENNPLISDNCFLGVTSFLQNQISVYPNPVNNQLNIEVQNEVIHKIQIYDALGRLVLEEHNIISTLDVSNLANGLFLVKIETENRVFTKKIIKE